MNSHQYPIRSTGNGGSAGKAMIPESHALQGLFTELVHDHFDREVGLRDAEVQDYIANVLSEFCDVEQLYKVRNAEGRALSDVGDYILFLSGMFPESINHFRLRRQRLENFVDFMKAGKESYYIVSKFDQFEYVKLAPLFAKLAHEFESCVYGLNLVKGDLQEMQHPITQQAKEIIM